MLELLIGELVTLTIYAFPLIVLSTATAFASALDYKVSNNVDWIQFHKDFRELSNQIRRNFCA